VEEIKGQLETQTMSHEVMGENGIDELESVLFFITPFLPVKMKA
jgi:hypothetical protein